MHVQKHISFDIKTDLRLVYHNHANHPQLLNFSKASRNINNLFSAMISYPMFLFAKMYFDLFLHNIILIDSSLS